MIAPQDNHDAVAREVWRREPWARAEARGLQYAGVPFAVVMIIALIALLPAVILGQHTLFLSVVTGGVAGGLATIVISAIVVNVRESSQRASIVAQLVRGVEPTATVSLGSRDGSVPVVKWLAIGNTAAFVVVGFIGFLVSAVVNGAL